MTSTCLCAEEIQELIDNKILLTNNVSIQPSSFEPQLTKKGYIIDAEEGLIRPRAGERVEELLKRMPERQRIEFSLEEGFELKAGFTYLLPLNTHVMLQRAQYIKSSPKSSLGRVFLNVRLVADYHPNFDEVHAHFAQGKECRLWLLVQPLVFNVIVHPGISLNQLRFFKGYGARLSAPKLYDYCETNPVLFADEKPSDHVVTEDGLWLHLSIPKDGVGALRARKNPRPIDLSKKHFYNQQEYFEEIFANNNRLLIRSKEHYLLATKECLQIPADLNAELRSHSHIGLQGPLHFAGFIDNGFSGDLVLEVRSDEITDMFLEDSMPIGVLDFYTTQKPKKLYGNDLGSNYQTQTGLKMAKYFKKG